MNKFTKTLMAAVACSVMATAAQAEEVFNPELQLNHSKEMIDLNNLKEQKKAALEIAIMDKEISKLKMEQEQTAQAPSLPSQAQQAATATSNQFASQLAEMQRAISELRKSGSAPSKIELEKGAASSFYVGYMEIASTVKAEMIVDGSRKSYSVGDYLPTGQKVKSISETSVRLVDKSGETTLPLQSTAQIAAKLYQAAKDDLSDNDRD
ncbi:hypothetical protein ACI2KR_07080 [Pseudomonas luteola]